MKEGARPVVIGLDLGSTTCKAVALDDTGEVCAVASHDYRLLSPHPGRVEQQPEEVWTGTVDVLGSVAEMVGTGAITALAIGGAMHTLMPVTEEGSPLAPAMSWADSRCEAQLGVLRERVDPKVYYQRTGCPLRTTYHPARLRWWQEEAEAVANATARWVSVKDWVLYRLTGRWVTDRSYASTTGLVDIHSGSWDEEALVLSGITAARLPSLVAPTETVGTVAGRAAGEVGLPEGVPVVAGGSDGGLAMLGTGAAATGDFVVTVGTSGAIRQVTDSPRLDEEERTWCYILDDRHWFAGGAINNGGLVQFWLWSRFFAEESGEINYGRIMQEAAKAPPGAAGLFVFPYFTGERSPHWAPSLRAAFLGLGLEHERPHLLRGTLESVAFCLADIWQAIRPERSPERPLRLTGGITKDPFWAQIVADVLGEPLLEVDVADASAIGAAMVGWRGLGEEVHMQGAGEQSANLLTPDPDRHRFYAETHHAWQALFRRVRGGEQGTDKGLPL